VANDTRRLDLLIGAKDVGASAVVAGVRQKVEKELNALQGLKKGLGEESAFGNVAKILSGTGAVAGLALAGRELNAIADKAGELARELRNGQKSGGEIAEELAKTIPIYGQIIEAGRKFRGLLDGTAADVERLTSFNKLIGESIDHQLEGIKLQRAEHRKLLEDLRDVKDRTALVGLVDPGRARTAAGQQVEKGRRQTDQAVKDATDAILARNAPELQKLQQAIQKKDREVAEASGALQELQEGIDKQRHLDATPDNPNKGVEQGTLNEAEDARRRLQDLRGERAQLQSQYTGIFKGQKEAVEEKAADLRKVQVEQEKLTQKELAEVEAAAQLQRERKTREGEQRIAKIQEETRQKALRAQGKGALADISGTLFGFKADQDNRQQQTRESVRESLRGGPLSLLTIASQAIREELAARVARDQDVRERIKAAAREKITEGLAAITEGVKNEVTFGPGSLLQKAGRFLTGGLLPNHRPDQPQAAGPFYAPYVDAGTSTGVGVAAAFGYGGAASQQSVLAEQVADLARKQAEEAAARKLSEQAIAKMAAAVTRLVDNIVVSPDGSASFSAG
jgi:soluble cytochrome b562